MRYLIRVAMSFALLLSASSLAWSSHPAQDPKDTGTITGRVTLDDRPAQGVILTATLSSPERTKGVERVLKALRSPTAISDSDGRYRFENLPSGLYYITPSAPALVNRSADKLETQVTVTSDATVERIDFSMTRGGVITGKITDNEGRPVISTMVSLKPVGNIYSAGFYSNSRDRMFVTDDRGIYRIFGLPAGRYLVSAGISDNSPFGGLLAGQSRVKTYYPGVTDEPLARPVEVTAGGEALGIDIKLGGATRGFAVSGRVVDAETRKPVGTTMVLYQSKARRDSSDRDKDGDDNDDEGVGSAGGFTITNAKGEFRFESVAPGSYKATPQSMGEMSGRSDYYAEPVDFEVRSSNLENLEIPVHSGASISGIVVVENAESPEIREQVGMLILSAMVHNVQPRESSAGQGRAAADGTFRIGGLKGGKASIRMGSYGPSADGAQKFSLLRIERNGVEQPDGIVVQPNEHITGVRVILVPANCVILGHVTLPGNSSPRSVLIGSARSTGSTQSDNERSFPVDEKGNFVIEDLGPGNYEIEIQCFAADANQNPPKPLGSARQNVTVVSGVPAQVNLVLDLNPKERDK